MDCVISSFARGQNTQLIPRYDYQFKCLNKSYTFNIGKVWFKEVIKITNFRQTLQITMFMDHTKSDFLR
jgi:hypothetical protein